jgi:hypothetical protein
LALLASPIVLAACGGAGEAATIVADAPVAAPPPTAAAPAPSAATEPTVPPPTSPPAPVATAAPVESVEPVSSGDMPGECPHGRWQIAPSDLSLVQMLAAGDMSASGSIIVDFADGDYTIDAQALEIDVVANGTEINIAVDGATTGTYTVGADGLTLASSSFAMEADLIIGGEPADDEFIANMFQQTFGSATVPFECHSDGTLVVTYPTPTGPMVAVHRAA